MKTTVIYGSVRRARQGIKGARFVRRMFEKRGHEVTLVDPAEFDLPLLDKMYKEYEPGQAPPAMQRLAEIYRATDAFVFVTAEYNHSVPPALVNLIDHFLNEFFWRPAGIVSYSAGSLGGVRAGVHLRAILGEVGLVTVPSMVALSQVRKSFNDEGEDQTGDYERRIQKFIDELEWYAGALGAARKSGVPYSYMPHEEHYRKLERCYLSAPTNGYYRPEIKIGDRVAEIAIPVRPEFLHAAAAVHGSVYFKALDDAAFFAANSVVETEFLLTASFTIYLLRPVSEGRLVARGSLVHQTRRIFTAEAVLFDSEGKQLGRGNGSFMRSGIPLDERVGYR